MISNFLPEQYKTDNELSINHNYLQEQFSDYEIILEKIKSVVQRGDFTLGQSVDLLEQQFASLIKTKHAIGVGSGTDAIFLSLKALGIQKGDEVITTPFTFFATVGAIVAAGAKPVFADIDHDYNINPNAISEKITANTKAILPVHWAGKSCRMDSLSDIANKNNLFMVEDACHAVMGHYKEKTAGSWGDLGCFSFHPLKNLNVWGDGGIITTNSDEYAERLMLLRNHGLKNRNECALFGYNSRLDSIQAIVALHLLEKLENITHKRIKNAAYLDEGLKTISEITIPPREKHVKHVYHLYSVLCENRDGLQQYLLINGIDAKVHYPIPIHLQSAAHYLGYQKGDFPVAEYIANHTLSLPVHEFITERELNKIIYTIKDFYAN